MGRFSLFLAVILLAACSRSAPVAYLSPSGAYSVTTEISGNDAGPVLRLCVRLKFLNTVTKQEFVFQTRASDVQKWALAWAPGGTLVLYSSDIGIMAYEIGNGMISERLATEQEQAVGRRAYEIKYGSKPRT